MKIKQLHQHLENNLTWYKHWHESTLHKIVHFGILIFTLLFTTGLILSSTQVSAFNTYYISPTGNNSAAGTISAPWGLTKLESITLGAGDIVYLRGGIYTSTKGASAYVHLNVQNQHGTAGNMITIANYPGEVPIFDLYSVGSPTNANPWAVILANSTYVDLKGLVIRNFRQAHSGTTGLGISRGFLISNSDNNTIEQLNIYNIAGTGFSVENSNNNLILNNDSHHNGEGYDTGYGAWNTGDGFAIGTGGDTSSNNIFKGNRMYLNSDDGIDAFDWAGTKVTYIGNWSFWNGVLPWKGAVDVPADAANTTSTVPTASMTPGGWTNIMNYVYAGWAGEGFKLGGTGCCGPAGAVTTLKKWLYNNLSFENTGGGFQQNMPAVGAHQMQLVNNIAWGNGNDGFGFGAGRSSNPSIAHIFMNNIAWNNNRGDSGGDFVFDGINGTSTTNGISVPSISTNYWHTQYQLNFGNLQSTSFQIAASDFQSLDSTGVDGPRQADGSLPNLPFLRLSATSKLIDKGTIINNLNGISIPFNGAKPDLGAFEYGTVTPGDTNPPYNVSLTAPTTGSVIFGTNIQASATAQDLVGVTKMEFYIDGTSTLLNCSPNPATTSPYNCLWNTTNTSNGPHTITAKAYDAAGNYAYSSVTNVTVNNPIASDTTAPIFSPAGSLTTPNSNISIASGTTYTISATATDNVAMSKVEFYKDGVLVNTQTSGPSSLFSYAWNTTGLAAGSTHSWTAKAYDTANPSNVATTQARIITITAGTGGTDTTPPSVTLTAPTAGYHRPYSGLTIKATAADNIGIAKVEFYVNDVLKCTDTTSTYTCSWNVPGTVASYTFTAKAYDAAGNSVVSAPIKITNTKKITPLVTANAGSNQTITLPINSVTLIGSYISDTLTTTSAWSRVSGSGTITSPTSLTTTVTGLTQGTSVFQLTVNNGTGGTAAATTSITVNPASTGASITFTVPLVLSDLPSGSTVSGNTSMQIDSITSANPITKVEFYMGTTKLGEDTTYAPYSMSSGWDTSSVSNGTYTFTVKVYDNAGNTATSPAVTYTINN